jgi:hypothetical protein
MTRIASALALLCLAAPALADEPTPVELVIRDHRFVPAEIHVPAGKPVVITVRNQDETAEEFDSSALKIEKVVAGGSYGTVRLRPLGHGRYPFTGEYHADTAQGVVIAE